MALNLSPSVGRKTQLSLAMFSELHREYRHILDYVDYLVCIALAIVM